MNNLTKRLKVNSRKLRKIKKIIRRFGLVLPVFLLVISLLAVKVKHRPSEKRLAVSATELYTHCFKFQTSSACHELGAYYQKQGDAKAALFTYARACDLGDTSSCDFRAPAPNARNEFEERTIAGTVSNSR